MLMQTLAEIAGEESAACRYEHSRSNGVANQYGRCSSRPAASVTVRQDVTLNEEEEKKRMCLSRKKQ